jgi:hypothetical protein
MADRQQFLRNIPVDPELQKVLEATKDKPVSEEELGAGPHILRARSVHQD